jgi:hypothetical protein
MMNILGIAMMLIVRYGGHIGKLWLARDWERPTKRAITAIIMHSDKTLLIKALSDITSQKLNDHRGLR